MAQTWWLRKLVDFDRDGVVRSWVFLIRDPSLCTLERDLTFPPSLLPRYPTLSPTHIYLSSSFLSCMGQYVTTVLSSWDLGLKKPNSLLLMEFSIPYRGWQSTLTTTIYPGRLQAGLFITPSNALQNSRLCHYNFGGRWNRVHVPLVRSCHF